MEDAKYISFCNHRITDEAITITKVDGEKVLYKAVLPYPAITVKGLTFIRTYNDEQNYINSDSNYKDTISCSYKTLTGSLDEIPQAGIINAIGITNYEFVTDTEIIFGLDEKDETIKKVSDVDGVLPKPIYLIDYSVKEDTCPLCQGTGIVQDINYDGTGSLMKATGVQKLIQRVLKTLLTKLGESAEDYSYGSSLDDLIGTEITQTSLKTKQKAINDAIQYVITLQENEDLDEEEAIAGITSISIEENKKDPSKLDITVVIRNVAGYDVPCTVTIKVD